MMDLGNVLALKSHKHAVYAWDSPSPSPALESTEVELAPHRDLGLTYLNASKNAYHTRSQKENRERKQRAGMAGEVEVVHRTVSYVQLTWKRVTGVVEGMLVGPRPQFCTLQ